MPHAGEVYGIKLRVIALSGLNVGRKTNRYKYRAVRYGTYCSVPDGTQRHFIIKFLPTFCAYGAFLNYHFSSLVGIYNPRSNYKRICNRLFVGNNTNKGGKEKFPTSDIRPPTSSILHHFLIHVAPHPAFAGLG